jgi:hypothetical protein
MKMTRYSDPQIIAILRQAGSGVPVSELCREHGMHGPAEYYETMFERGATRRSTNGGRSMAGCPLGDASIACPVIAASRISQMKALE